MNKERFLKSQLMLFFCLFFFLLGTLGADSAYCGSAVNVILKNASSATVEAELTDQHGGNFTASLDAGMSQNHSLKVNSEVKVNGNTVHVVTSGDEGKEVVVAGP